MCICGWGTMAVTLNNKTWKWCGRCAELRTPVWCWTLLSQRVSVSYHPTCIHTTRLKPKTCKVRKRKHVFHRISLQFIILFLQKQIHNLKAGRVLFFWINNMMNRELWWWLWICVQRQMVIAFYECVQSYLYAQSVYYQSI